MGCFPVFLGYFSTDVITIDMFKFEASRRFFALLGFYIMKKFGEKIQKELFKNYYLASLLLLFKNDFDSII